MIYYTALIMVTVGALCNKSAFPYAVVLCSVWAVFWMLGAYNLYGLYPWIDAISIYPLALLAYLRPKWWNLTIVGLCFLTVTSHLVFWTAYYSDVYLGEEYKIALRSLFLLSMAVALIGDVDVKRLVGLAVERLRGVFSGSPSAGFARGVSGQTCPKEAVSDRVRIGAVCAVQHSQHRMGDWQTDLSGGNDSAQAGFPYRCSDVGSNCSVHLSTKEA